MPRTVSNLPGPVATWIMGALAKGQRVHYYVEDPSGYVDSIPAVDRLGRPVINEGEGAAGQRMYRNVTKAETLPLYRITPLSLELPEKNNLYIFASVVAPSLIFTSDRGMGMWDDGVNEDSAFYTSPTVKYRRVCVTPDNQVFPQERITGFSSGQDKMLIAAVAIAAGGYLAYGGGGAAVGGVEAAAGAEIVGPVAPEVAGGAGGSAVGASEGITLAGVGKSAAGVVKGAVDVAKGAVAVAGAVTQVSAALNNSGGGNTAPPPAPPADNSVYWMVGGAIVLLGVLT